MKSLCGFPDVLQRLNDNLDWTQDLGDAFLAQESEVMDAVQRMRRRAYDAGTLQSSAELKVTDEPDKLVVIEQAQPDVIYVPRYYPSAVYDGWGYPYWYYPALYVPPPVGGSWFGFTTGVIWPHAFWGGCNWGWGHSHVDIDVHQQNIFIDRTEIGARRELVKQRAGIVAGAQQTGTMRTWQHDPVHRMGVRYRNPGVASRFVTGPGRMRISREQARGFVTRLRQGGVPSARVPADTVRTPRRPATAGAQRPPQTARPPNLVPRNTGQRSSPFSGSRSPGFDRAGSSRGALSRSLPGQRRDFRRPQ